MVQMKKEETEGETSRWFNVMFVQLWPKIWGSLAESLKSTLNQKLEAVATQSWPIRVVPFRMVHPHTSYQESVTITDMYFGDVSPVFSAVQSSKPQFPDYVSCSASRGSDSGSCVTSMLAILGLQK